ncbi:hypothetical protein A2U01_0009922, partial [Trifolium medium]|nr:hypothetical protein [Trifolium medium]MCH89029.1 hypothetical protein [Trifolium medium]
MDQWSDDLERLFRKAYKAHGENFKEIVADRRFKNLIVDKDAFDLKVKDHKRLIDATIKEAKAINKDRKGVAFPRWKVEGAEYYLELAIFVHDRDCKAILADENFKLLKNFPHAALNSKWSRIQTERAIAKRIEQARAGVGTSSGNAAAHTKAGERKSTRKAIPVK